MAARLDSESLEERLKERLSAIEYGFFNETREYTAVMTELNIVSRMNVQGVSSTITSVSSNVVRLNESRIAFNTAKLLLEEGSYAEAILQLMLVIEEDPSYDRAADKMRRATDTYRAKALDSAESYSSEGDYEKAILILNEALAATQNDSKIALQLTIYEMLFETTNRQKVFDAASVYANTNNWPNAIAVLNAGLDKMSGDASIEDRLRIYEQFYVMTAISQADTLVAQGEYNEAILILSNVLYAVPNNAQIMQQISIVQELMPISLSTLVVINSRNYLHELGLLIDNLENHHREWFSFRVSVEDTEDEHLDNRSYATHHLNGDFSLFTADIVATPELHPDTQFLIEVTLDDDASPVFSFGGFTAQTGIVRINADISDAATMTISVRATAIADDAELTDQSIYLVNTVLTS